MSWARNWQNECGPAAITLLDRFCRGISYRSLGGARWGSRVAGSGGLSRERRAVPDFRGNAPDRHRINYLQGSANAVSSTQKRFSEGCCSGASSARGARGALERSVVVVVV